MFTSNNKNAVLQDAVGILYRNQRRTVWFTAFAALVEVGVLLPHVNLQVLLSWFAAILVVTIGRYFAVRAGLRRADFGRSPQRDERWVAVGGAVSGALLGLPILAFGPQLPAGVIHALGIVTVAMAGGAAATMLTSRIAFLSYVLPMLGLTAVAYFRTSGGVPGDINTLHGIAILVFATGIVYVHAGMCRCLLGNLALSQEKESMLREKEALLIRLEMDNAELLADRDAFLIESLTDSLTGLANRRHFDKTLIRDWERARRESMCLSCVMLDVDHFKPYNDRHGHSAGDDTLKAVAAAITSSLNRGSDFAARYGGEEFVILLPGTDLEGSVLLAERIRSAIEQMKFVPDARLTVSAGVASVLPGTLPGSPARLLALADDALYQAKADGRNRVVTRRDDESDDTAVDNGDPGVVPDPA